MSVGLCLLCCSSSECGERIEGSTGVCEVRDCELSGVCLREVWGRC